MDSLNTLALPTFRRPGERLSTKLAKASLRKVSESCGSLGYLYTRKQAHEEHTHTLTHMAHRHAHTPCLLTAREGAGAAGGEKEEGVGELRASSDLLNVNRKCDDSLQQYPMQMYYSNSINNR